MSMNNMPAMNDMLVRLYELPDVQDHLKRLGDAGMQIRRPNCWEKPLLLDWIRTHFIASWMQECEIAFTVRPPSCFIAVHHDAIEGFACYDCTRLNFFGPTGVADNARGKGIGTALLLLCLHAMKDSGYAYAIIGGVGPEAFYTKTAGATRIERSSPGIYDFSLLQR